MWKTRYEPNPPGKGKAKTSDTGTLTATFTEGDFTLTVVDKNFEPDDESSIRDFVAKAKGDLGRIKGTEEKMDGLLNAAPPAA
jgi:hypothetical protein